MRTGRRRVPAGGRASPGSRVPEVRVPGATRVVLPNGLTVIHAQDAGRGLASAQAWVRTGSVHEGACLGSGLSHYLEHLVFKGTAKRAGRVIAEEVQSHGGSLNAYTTFDRTVYHVDLPAEHVGVALDVLADMVFAPTLPEAEVERERSVILREIDMTLDDPETVLWQAVFENAFRQHPYRQPVIGRRELFERVTREDLVTYHAARYVPANTVLVVAGDFTWEEVEPAVRSTFGAVPARPVAPVAVPVEPAQLAAREHRLFQDLQLTRGGLCWPIPGLAHPDAPALDVLSVLLGGGHSSLLWRRLREERRLVHTIDASAWNPGDQGLFFVGFESDPERRGAVLEAVREELAGAASRRFTAAEVSKVIRQVVMNEVHSRKTVSGVAARLGMAEVVVGDLDHFSGYLQHLRGVTADDLRRVAAAYLVPERRTVVTLEPKSARPAVAAVAGVAARPRVFVPVALPGGARLLVEEDDRLPVAHVRVLARGGPAYEDAGQEGVSALLSTVLTRDTKARSGAEVDEAIESVGGSFGSFSGNNSLGLSVEVMPQDLSLAMDLLAEALLRPAFRPATVRTERESQVAALRDEMDDVVSLGRLRMRERFFGGHPLAVGGSGRLETVPGLGVAALRAHRERILRPSNVVFAVSGAVRASAVEKSVAAIARALPKGAFDVVARPYAGPEVAERHEERVPREQAIVYWAYPGPGVTDVDAPVADLLHELFSGLSSRLFERIREERGLAYFVRGSRIVGVEAGCFFLECGTHPGAVAEVEKEFAAEVERVSCGKVEPSELLRCQRRVVAQRRLALQTPGARAMHAGLNVLFGLPPDDPVGYAERVQSTTARELAGAAARWLQPERRTAVVLLPVEAGGGGGEAAEVKSGVAG